MYCSAMLCVAGVGCVLADDARAADMRVSVINQKFSFDLDPGEERTMDLPIINPQDTELAVTVDALDYRVADENTVVVEQIDEPERSLRQWLTMQPQSLTLAPHGTATIQVTMRVPHNATLGSHHGLIVVRVPPDAADVSGAQIMTQGQVGVHVLVNVRGQSRASGSMESFSAPLFFNKHVMYTAVFRNDGNVHYVPACVVRVRNIFTMAVANADINVNDRFAFPGAKLTLSSEQPLPSRWGLYRIHAQIVDGDRIVHTRARMMMGVFFPIVAIAAGGVGAGVGWWVYRMRRRTLPKDTILMTKNNRQ